MDETFKPKVRPFYRVLASIVSLFGWLSFLIAFGQLFSYGLYSLSVWVSIISAFSFSFWLTYIAITGKAPTLLKNWLNV
ncbi:hypothetical protein GTQ48_12100 [Alteromonas genovensis]|jgi:hypothetical protein|uniref:Uncharacterized protein n=1 Tax=Alteromonas genovensis TaxID=471225 RepID=A0A6N9TGJ7_9ALTE|nr:hypothetical protein [Alteromonas genovensis]NDW16261.1 hypothetical protein [Alteromonas genovensis]